MFILLGKSYFFFPKTWANPFVPSPRAATPTPKLAMSWFPRIVPATARPAPAMNLFLPSLKTKKKWFRNRK